MKLARTRSLSRAIVLLCAAGGALSCAAADPDPSARALRAAISGGQPDSVDSNVFVLGSHRSASELALCSASLIAPNLLLTARHCVSTVTERVICGQTVASAPFAANTFFASSTESIDEQGSTFFAVSDVSVPPESTEVCGFDLALVTLSTLVPASVATPLVPRIDRPVARGESYRAVGYGEDTPDDGGVAGNRMGRAGLKVGCTPGKCGAEVANTEFIGDTGVCSGDSGGPALDATGKVVGVVSRGAVGCTIPVYGSVASWRDWISGVAQHAAAEGGYTPDFWVTTGLSDPPTVDPSGSGSAGAPGGAGSTSGAQGNKCEAAGECKAGFGCYSPTNTASNAYCAAFCSVQTECAKGTQCKSDVGVCVAGAASSVDSSSCAVAVAGANPLTASRALFGLVALGLASWRRRRRLQRRSKKSEFFCD